MGLSFDSIASELNRILNNSAGQSNTPRSVMYSESPNSITTQSITTNPKDLGEGWWKNYNPTVPEDIIGALDVARADVFKQGAKVKQDRLTSGFTQQEADNYVNTQTSLVLKSLEHQGRLIGLAEQQQKYTPSLENVLTLKEPDPKLLGDVESGAAGGAFFGGAPFVSNPLTYPLVIPGMIVGGVAGAAITGGSHYAKPAMDKYIKPLLEGPMMGLVQSGERFSGEVGIAVGKALGQDTTGLDALSIGRQGLREQAFVKLLGIKDPEKWLAGAPYEGGYLLGELLAFNKLYSAGADAIFPKPQTSVKFSEGNYLRGKGELTSKTEGWFGVKSQTKTPFEIDTKLSSEVFSGKASPLKSLEEGGVHMKIDSDLLGTSVVKQGGRTLSKPFNVDTTTELIGGPGDSTLNFRSKSVGFMDNNPVSLSLSEGTIPPIDTGISIEPVRGTGRGASFGSKYPKVGTGDYLLNTQDIILSDWYRVDSSGIRLAKGGSPEMFSEQTMVRNAWNKANINPVKFDDIGKELNINYGDNFQLDILMRPKAEYAGRRFVSTTPETLNVIDINFPPEGMGIFKEGKAVDVNFPSKGSLTFFPTPEEAGFALPKPEPKGFSGGKLGDLTSLRGWNLDASVGKAPSLDTGKVSNFAGDTGMVGARQTFDNYVQNLQRIYGTGNVEDINNIFGAVGKINENNLLGGVSQQLRTGFLPVGGGSHINLPEFSIPLFEQPKLRENTKDLLSSNRVSTDFSILAKNKNELSRSVLEAPQIIKLLTLPDQHQDIRQDPRLDRVVMQDLVKIPTGNIIPNIMPGPSFVPLPIIPTNTGGPEVMPFLSGGRGGDNLLGFRRGYGRRRAVNPIPDFDELLGIDMGGGRRKKKGRRRKKGGDFDWL